MMLDGHISKEVYTTDGIPNAKKLVQVVGPTGQHTRVHIDRLLDPDAQGRAVAIPSGHSLRGICPTCRAECDVKGGKIDCAEHGSVPITVPLFLQEKELPEQMTQAPDQNGQVDLGTIAEFGCELWTKRRLHFDVATMNVNAHVLLATGPDRKLCFNTYDNTLGKRRGDPVEVLRLKEFAEATVAIAGEKAVGYLLPNGLEAERKRLAKTGYQREFPPEEAVAAEAATTE